MRCSADKLVGDHGWRDGIRFVWNACVFSPTLLYKVKTGRVVAVNITSRQGRLGAAGAPA